MTTEQKEHFHRYKSSDVVHSNAHIFGSTEALRVSFAAMVADGAAEESRGGDSGVREAGGSGEEAEEVRGSREVRRG